MTSAAQHKTTNEKTMGLTQERRDEIGRIAAKILLDTKSVLFNSKEPFILTSGRVSPVYIDCRRLIGFQEERDTLMDFAVEMLSEEIGSNKLDYIAGGETAGIPYAGFISQLMKKPMLYVRKKPKGFGRMAQIEGYMQESGSPNVILVEDLQTDGGSKKTFINVLRQAGATVKHAFVVFHYGIFERSKENMDKMGITLHELTNWWYVLEVAKNEAYFDEDTLESVESFLEAPDIWAEAHADKKGAIDYAI